MTDTIEEESSDPSFESMGLSEQLLDAVHAMGWVSPTPVQSECFSKALSGADLIVQSRTGTGKTGAFGMPLVDGLIDPRPGVQALVLAPTRELALQSAREIGRLAAHKEIRTTAVYGGAPMERQVRELAQGAQIVSGTPGRVLDHLRRGTLDPSGLRVLVLDEADEMLSMGFAKELNAILELLPPQRQTLLFSATVDGPIQRVGERHMREPQLVELSGDAIGALTVTHYVYMISGKGRTNDLIRVLEVEDPESAIVFCNTKVETEQVAAQLQGAGFQADWLNGDLPQKEREKKMAATRAGELRYLVATDVAARGIDISHLTHVVNYSLPEHIEQYIHRTGRTGRAGRTGTAVTLVAPQELGTLYHLRLQYKIFPIERSLPSDTEERTRRELDRIEFIRSAVSRPTELDLAVARRLLTHPEAESLVASVMGMFFGPRRDTVDDEAAAGRRDRRPPPIKAAEREAEADPGSDTDAVPVSEDPVSDARASDARGRARDAEPVREKRVREKRDEARSDAREDRDEVKLYVGVGKKDGISVGDVNRFFIEELGLERDEVGRIRIRDKHTFVFVPAAKLDAVIAATEGKQLGGRDLKVEQAKSDRKSD